MFFKNVACKCSGVILRLSLLETTKTRRFMSEMTEINITKDKLINDLKAVQSDMEGLMKEVGGQLGGRASELREKLDCGVKKVKSQIEDLEKNVACKGKVAVRATDEFVHDHPWESVGIGFGLGLLIGVLLNRR